MRTMIAALIAAGGLLMGVPAAMGQAGASTSTFSYQGVLEENGEPATGPHQFTLLVYDAETGGVPLCTTLSTVIDLQPEDEGRFSLDDLSCPGVFDGSGERWVEVLVRRTTEPSSTVLSPRRLINAAPFANFAEESGTSLQDAYENGASIDASISNPVVIDGRLQLGVAGQDGGSLQVLSSDATPTPVANVDYNAFLGGGSVRISSDAGVSLGGFEPDFNEPDVASFMSLVGSSGQFQWDGRGGGTGATGGRLGITGPQSGFSFNTNVVGDSSLVIPNDSVGMQEIEGEAGIAAFGENALNLFIIGDAVENVASRTITVPGPGTVVAIATVELFVESNSTATSIGISTGVSESPTSFSNGLEFDTSIRDFSGNLTSDDYTQTVHSVFETPSAGSYTYYLNVRGDSDLVSLRAADVALTLIYIPTAYGTVVPASNDLPRGVGDADVPARAGRTMQEIEAERLESIAANNARIERELEAMRAEVAALRRALEEARAEQDAGRDGR